MLDAVTDGAAFVRNGRMDILAANPLARAFYRHAFDSPAQPPNLARFTFLDERAVEFYRKLFDWDIRGWDSPDNKAEIHMIKTVPTDETGRPTRPGINGMILKKQNPGHPFANYINVESVDEYAAKVVALGGQIAMPKTAVPGMGWFLYFLDTEGNIMGLWQEDPTAA